MGGKGGCFRCRDQPKTSIVRWVSRSLEEVDVETRWRAGGTVEGLERQAQGLGHCCKAGGATVGSGQGCPTAGGRYWGRDRGGRGHDDRKQMWMLTVGGDSLSLALSDVNLFLPPEKSLTWLELPGRSLSRPGRSSYMLWS